MNDIELKAALHTLHRYYIWAHEMQKQFYDLVPKVTPEMDRFDPIPIMTDTYMSFWYGELYVVVEGYEELGLHDPEIDALLASPNRNLLRLYRNGVFHFQKDYFDNRLLGFLQQQDTPTWSLKLSERMGAFLLSELQRLPGKVSP